jgi:dTDP-4-dehydrorhamnose 3,5-epimerase
MKIEKTGIEGLLIVQPEVFRDERGHFLEFFKEDLLAAYGIASHFVQDNESFSGKHVLRGLHFQRPPYAQAKLVRVALGMALDVAVDIRKHSPTYGHWESVVLSQDNMTMLYIPEGFAHGFLTLEDKTVFQYKCSAYYHQDSETAIRWNDPDLGIHWGIPDPVVSIKDSQAILFKDLASPF